MPRTKSQFTELLTDVNIATKAKLIPKAVDQILHSNVIMHRLHKRSKAWAEGKRIEFSLRYGKGEVVEKNSGFEKIITQMFEMYEKGFVYGQTLEEAIGLDGQDIDVFHVSKMKLLNITADKIKTLTEDFERKHSEMLFRVTSKDKSKFPSFHDMFADASESTEICGIKPSDLLLDDATNYAFNWKPKVYDYSNDGITYENLVDPTSKYFIEKLLKRAISNITETSGKKPTLIVLTQYVWDAYDEVLTGRQMGTLGEKTFDGYYDYIKLRGVDIVADSWCPGGAQQPASTSTAYIINENFLQLFHAPGLNHKYYPWKELEEQWVYRAMMRHFGSIAPTRRDVHGAILGLPSEHIPS